MNRTVCVLTVSDACAAGSRNDLSGPALEELLNASDWTVQDRRIVADDVGAISGALIAWADSGCDLILTTGGTGFSPRDVTPEATAAVMERQAAGLAELLRWSGYQTVPQAVLSRGVAGIRGRTLIVNLAGSPAGAREGLETLLPLLPHAIALLQGRQDAHPPMTTGESPGNATDADTFTGPVTVVEVNLDDLSPQFYASAMARLFDEGALDVFIVPTFAKKGRPGSLLTVLCPPERTRRIAEALFAETTTFGVRYHLSQRLVLTRDVGSVDTEYGAIRVKVGRWRGERMSVSPVYEDVRAAADAHHAPVRLVYLAAQRAYEEAERGAQVYSADGPNHGARRRRKDNRGSVQ